MRRVLLGFIVMAIGIAMGLNAAGIIDLCWFQDCEWRKYIIPLLIIIVGLKLVFGHTRVKRDGCEDFKAVDTSQMKEGDIVHATVAFSGSRYNMNDQLFNGAKIDVFCGGVTLDLYGAEIADKCMIEVHTLMGGVEIRVPSNIRFIVSSNCLLGGVNNKYHPSTDSFTKTIYLKAECLLGGVEIR